MKNIYTLLQKITIPLIITLLIITVYSSFKRSSSLIEQTKDNEQAFIPLTNEPIMGYWFSEPQKVPNSGRKEGFKIIDWLPNNSDIVLLEGVHDLETININTGEATLYATITPPTDFTYPTWIPSVEGLAYFRWETDGKPFDLWLAKQNTKPKLLASRIGTPLIPTKEEGGIAVYSRNKETMEAIWLTSPHTNTIINTFNHFLDEISIDYKGMRHWEYQPQGDIAAFYISNRLWFVDLVTGKYQEVNIKSYKEDPIWIMKSTWSPDGRWFAMIMGENAPPITASYIYLFDLETSNLHKIEDDFNYILDIAWAPDSQHLLCMPIIGMKDGHTVETFYLFNILNPTEFINIPIPQDGLRGISGHSLTWSPNGKTILVTYYDGQEITLQQINVTKSI